MNKYLQFKHPTASLCRISIPVACLVFKPRPEWELSLIKPGELCLLGSLLGRGGGGDPQAGLMPPHQNSPPTQNLPPPFAWAQPTANLR